MKTLYDGTTSVLERLGDLENKAWSRDEIDLYLKDGYDQFCHRTRCLFDIHVIENLPVTGNYTTDFERYIAESTPGMAVTDRPFHFTGAHEKKLSADPIQEYGGSYSGPAPATSPSETDQFSSDNFDLPSVVTGGDMPHSTIEVLRVSYNQRTLRGMSSQQMKDFDPNYESRTGDPQWWCMDKDGIFYLRVVPAATGNATYDTVDGSWGFITQHLDADSAVEDTIYDTGTGGWGFLTHRDDMFPAGGPHGSATRVHPYDLNIVVETYRLGRNLDTHPFELPQAYLKYVYFYAMGQALERIGPGQDLELANHYFERFEMGISRMTNKKREMDVERVGRFGGGEPEEMNFGLGDPQPPFPYGVPF